MVVSRLVKFFTSVTFSLLAASLLAACASTSDLPSLNIKKSTDKQSNAEVENLVSNIVNSQKESRRGVFRSADTVLMKVYRFDDLSGEFVVDSQGNIDFPLIGMVQVLDLSVEGLQKHLTQKYAEKYIQNPTITIKRIAKDKAITGEIVIDGPVEKPGVYELTDNITLLKAIAIAGGTKVEQANTKKVYLIRESQGKRLVATYNLKDIREKGAPDPTVIPNDAIVVDYAEIAMTVREIIRASPFVALFLRR